MPTGPKGISCVNAAPSGGNGRSARHERLTTLGNAFNTAGHYTEDPPAVPLRNFPVPCRGSWRSGFPSMPCTVAGRPRQAITKAVIYITLDNGCHNVLRLRASPFWPALYTGKPITAGVVWF